MKESKVKIFDKRLSNFQSRELCNKLDGKVVKDWKIECDGKVYNIMDYEVRDGNYCEFDDDEKMGLDMFRSLTKQAKELYDNALKKQEIYESLLLNKIDKEADFGDEREKCECSPFDICCYKSVEGGKKVCVFCGRERERWILR